jgi:hypothetical protein
MSHRLESLFSDTRNHFRIIDRHPVFWKITEGAQSGKAKIRNVSASGMMIETNGSFVPPKDGCLFSFDTTLGHENYIPQYGELVWSRKISRAKNKYQCGVRFFEPAEYIQGKLRQKIQKGILRMATAKRATRIFSALLTSGIVVLTGLAVWLSRDIYHGLSSSSGMFIDVTDKQAALISDYKGKWQTAKAELIKVTDELNETKELYRQSQSQLGVVTQELSDTQAILVETEAMLAQARAGAAQLAGDFEATLSKNEALFNASRAQFESEIAALALENANLEKEVGTLQQQLSFYEGNIKNMDDGYVLLNIYRERMKVVKDKIRDFKKDVRDLRRRAQNERDRIQLEIGNNGYFVKNGAVVTVDMEKYNAVTTAPATVSRPVEGLAPKVEINVTNFD